MRQGHLFVWFTDVPWVLGPEQILNKYELDEGTPLVVPQPSHHYLAAPECHPVQPQGQGLL